MYTTCLVTLSLMLALDLGTHVTTLIIISSIYFATTCSGQTFPVNPLDLITALDVQNGKPVCSGTMNSLPPTSTLPFGRSTVQDLSFFS